MTIRLRSRLPRRPRVGRCSATAALLLAFVGGAQAQEIAALTEREVVTRTLARAPLSDVLEGPAEAEQGRARSLGVLPNPELSYSRQQTFGPTGTAEDYLTISQSFDLGGQRTLRASASGRRADAARLDADAARLAIASEARTRFFEVLYRQQRVAVLERWAAHVAEALTVVSKRERRGDVSAYDRRRLEREQVVAAGRLATERAALGRARARLAALLGDGAPSNVTGQLLPDADPPPLDTLRAASAKRPDFLALDQLGQAAGDERAAAKRWWVPDLRLEAGWKGVDSGDTRSDGYTFGVALALPLWDRSAGLAQTAAGEARSVRGRRALLQSELIGELGGARAEAVELRSAALVYRQQTASHSTELERMATVGYEAGELSLLELLDAYRGAADDELAALDMEHAARRARLELDQMTGAGLP